MNQHLAHSQTLVSRADPRDATSGAVEPPGPAPDVSRYTRRYSITIEPHYGHLLLRWTWTVRVHNTNPNLPILWATGHALTRAGADGHARRAIHRHRVWLERLLRAAR